MDYTPGPIDPVDPGRGFVARAYTDRYASIVAQFQLDAGGAGAAIDSNGAAIAELAGVDLGVDLGPHEADLAASNDDDDTALPALALADELDATTAAGPTIDAGLSAAGDAGDAHATLSTQIDDGQAEIPAPPDNPPPVGPTDPGLWKGHTREA